MPTTTSPPILIWQPGGGVPVGPISNPPVYSQADITPLVIGQNYVDVVFGSVQTDNSWVLVECDVVNTADLSPLNIWPGIITNRTTAGFRVWLNGLPDTGNYYLHWAVSGVNIPPVPATTYFLVTGTGLTFTVSLPPGTSLSVPLTVTPHDGDIGGSFSPSTGTLTNSSRLFTFTYIPVSYGAVTISTTNDSGLFDPAPIIVTVVAPTYTLTGPSGGASGVASTNFTVTFPTGVLGTVIVTMHDGGGGGTFAPTTLSLVASGSGTFTYTPASAGAKTISVTNGGGLTDPGSLTYTATVANHLLNTLISYWKMDEASGTRSDSQGTNHLTDHGVTSSAGVIGNAAVFTNTVGVYLDIPSNATLQVTGDFTFSIWIKPTIPADTVLIIKNNGTTNEYVLLSNDASGSGITFYAGSAAPAQVGSIPTLGAWMHIVAWFDSSDGKGRIRINDATTYVGASTGTLSTTAANFTVGAGTGGGGSIFGGLIDEVGFWKRKLTSGEITQLYNGGAGFPFGSFTT